MPAKKRDVKEEPSFVDEEGCFVHEEEQARYTGGIRCMKYPVADAAGGTSSMKSSSKTRSAATPEPSAAPTTRYRHGVGEYSCPALTYAGEWVEDVMHGHGRLHFRKSGCTYEGDFRYGRFDGEGVYTWPDGAQYDGMWRDNRMHGAGVYTDADGTVWRGKYFNGTGPGLERLFAKIM